MIGFLFFLGSLLLVCVSIFLGGQPAAYWSGISALLVIVGTLTVTAISIRQSEWPEIYESIKGLFTDSDFELSKIANHMLELSSRIRRDGIQCLEQARIGLRHIPFLNNALMLVLDGHAPEAIERLLIAEADTITRRRLRLAQILQRAADVAPAMGLIGTLIGLVQMLGQLNDPKQLGPAMSIALLTTLYGAMMAHVIFLPLSARVEAQASEEQCLYALCAAGASALSRGEHPIHLESQLNALLPEQQRVQAA